MKDEAARLREVAPQHAQYWRDTDSTERQGPFSPQLAGPPRL